MCKESGSYIKIVSQNSLGNIFCGIKVWKLGEVIDSSTLRLNQVILDLNTKYPTYAQNLGFKYENTYDMRFILKPFEVGDEP